MSGKKKDFESGLKRAAEAYVNDSFAGDPGDPVGGSLEARAAALLAEKGGSPRRKEYHRMKTARKRKWTAVVAAAALVAVLGAAVAAGPVFRNFLNTRTAQESAEQLTEVPEGWIGVYTAEDLDAVREDLCADYILMNDIVFSPEDFGESGVFAGGWRPIGDEREPFRGTFNGNGHVIRGLVISAEKAFPAEKTVGYAGLFGYCRLEVSTDYREDLDPETAAANGYRFFEEISADSVHMENVYVRERHSGYIKNLGLRDCRIRAVYGPDSLGDRLFVGSVAGYSEYVLNCFAENVTVEAEVTAPMREVTGLSPIAGAYTDMTHFGLFVGGLTGGCYLMDNCRTDASVTVRADDADVPVWHIGGLTGMTVTCITSYFDGSVDAGTLPDDGMFYIIRNDVPHIMTETVFEEIESRLREILENKANMFCSFYCKREVGLPDAWRAVARDLIAEDPDGIAFYVCDPGLKPREYAELSSLIAEAFPDGGFETYCRENGVKYGCYYVYDLRDNPAPDFEGFDPAIWDMTPGKAPVLKIFG